MVSDLFAPVVLTSTELNNSYYTSELTLTNRGSETATLHYTYTAAAGGGTGTDTTEDKKRASEKVCWPSGMEQHHQQAWRCRPGDSAGARHSGLGRSGMGR